MKKLLIILFILSSFFIYSDEAKVNKFPFVSFDTVGALLFAENCLGCHEISYFTAAVPNEEQVEELVKDIDYMIYSPGSAMAVLSILTPGELEKIARFLIYGSHIDGWVSNKWHGEVVEEQGSDTCLKCHDNEKIKKVEIPGCSECH